MPSKREQFYNRRDEEVIRAMREAEGDLEVAAALLGVKSIDMLKRRIEGRPKLKMLFGDKAVTLEDDFDLSEDPDMETAEAAIASMPQQLAKEILGMDTALLQVSLGDAGVDKTTIKRIAAVAEAQQNMAMALGMSLKWTNANASILQTKLAAQIESIQANELNPESDRYVADSSERIFWLQLVAKLSDSSMKAGDRILQGNQVLVKLMAEARKRLAGKKGMKRAGKPGFSERR